MNRGGQPWGPQPRDDWPNGPLYMFWYCPEQRRVRKKSLRTKDPEMAKARFRLELAMFEVVQTPKDRIYQRPADTSRPATVEGSLREYLDNCTAKAKWRQEIAAGHLQRYFRNEPLVKVNKRKTRAYAAWRAEDGAAPTTIRRELNVLVAAANWCLGEEMIQPADLPRVELPDHEEAREISFFTEDEVRRMLDRPRDIVWAFTTLAYYSAARRSRIEGLRVEQIRERRIHLTPEGEKITAKRAAVVPINEPMRAAIDWLLETHERGGWLFGRKIDIYKRFAKVCADLGFEPHRRHPHMLRHSRATHLIDRLVPEAKVARLLGDTIETVRRNYVHHTPEFLDDTMDEI